MCLIHPLLWSSNTSCLGANLRTGHTWKANQQKIDCVINDNIYSGVRNLASALGQEYNVDKFTGVDSKGPELNPA